MLKIAIGKTSPVVKAEKLISVRENHHARKKIEAILAS